MIFDLYEFLGIEEHIFCKKIKNLLELLIVNYEIIKLIFILLLFIFII